MAEDRDIVISAAAAERILRLRDGRAALYYLHLLSGGGAGAESTARALGWSESETLAAQAALSAAGVLPQAPLEPEAPTYSSQDLIDATEGDPAFAELIKYAQARMNYMLTPADTIKLLEIRNHLGMPVGEIMLIISWCVTREMKKKGSAARIGMWVIEREAYRWQRDGIDTEEKAERYVRGLEALDASVERLKAVLQIRGRELTESERKYLEKWSASGLKDEVIYAAYDRTVLATGSLKWPYMDRIIDDWKQNGVPDLKAAAPSKEKKPSAGRKEKPQGDEESAAELFKRMFKEEGDKA